MTLDLIDNAHVLAFCGNAGFGSSFETPESYCWIFVFIWVMPSRLCTLCCALQGDTLQGAPGEAIMYKGLDSRNSFERLSIAYLEM